MKEIGTSVLARLVRHIIAFLATSQLYCTLQLQLGHKRPIRLRVGKLTF